MSGEFLIRHRSVLLRFSPRIRQCNRTFNFGFSRFRLNSQPTPLERKLVEKIKFTWTFSRYFFIMEVRQVPLRLFPRNLRLICWGLPRWDLRMAPAFPTRYSMISAPLLSNTRMNPKMCPHDANVCRFSVKRPIRPQISFKPEWFISNQKRNEGEMIIYQPLTSRVTRRNFGGNRYIYK